ncbi:MAG: hypothetical protein P4M07_21790 [Xanthobacteraceae bacterium]|nr:hypothetical protein [Xanthobacteraceae bacterium]
MRKPSKRSARRILTIDVGGSHVKVVTNRGRARREFKSGRHLSGEAMVRKVKHLTRDWTCDVISVGYP